MSGVVRFQGAFQATHRDLPVGPYLFDRSEVAVQPVAYPLTIPDATTVQLIGGGSPLFPAIATLTTLALFQSDQPLLLAWNGADISTESVSVSAGAVWVTQGISVTEVRLRNASGSVATALVVVDGASA